MDPIDNIRNLAQDVYISINGSENDDTNEDAEAFENNFIRSFNLWLDEYEGEAYWNKLRENDTSIATLTDPDQFSFAVPDTYRTPVFDENRYVKLVDSEGNVITKFKLVNPNQRIVDDAYTHPDRATYVDDNIVLSRKPKAHELGLDLVLDLVKYHSRLTRNDDDGIAELPSRQLAVLGVAKNMTLGDVTKVSLNPVFTQKYTNELQKAVMGNNATNEVDEMRRTSYSYIDGIW